MIAATTAKTAVEDRQRELAKQRETSGKSVPEPRFFKHEAGDKWMPRIGVDTWVLFFFSFFSCAPTQLKSTRIDLGKYC